MKGRHIDASYAGYRLQVGAHEHARRSAILQATTTGLLETLGLSDLVGEIVKNRRTKILERFEQAGRQIQRQAFTDLVSAFEADLFKAIGAASSKVRHVLNKHYDRSYPFFACREDLARTPADFSNLGGYRRLLATTSTSSADPRRDLWDIVAYRDFLAHGERWQYRADPPTVEAAYAITSRELDEIEARR